MWDEAFAIQAIMSSNLTDEYGPTLHKAHNFLKASQVRDNPSGNFESMHTHISKGAWAFSMQDHGWQVSDCIGETFFRLLHLLKWIDGFRIYVNDIYSSIYLS